jgi:large subunit ribosomal protein L18e
MKNISKNKISKRTKNKKNPEIIEIINLAKKNNLLDLAKKLSAPRSQYKNINLDEINDIDGESILVVGKVLGSGNVNRKIDIAAISFSEQAKAKLNKLNCNSESIYSMLKKKPGLEGVRII